MTTLPAHRRVKVQMGVVRPPPPARLPPLLAMLALGDTRGEPLAPLHPDAVMKAVRDESTGVTAEQIRLSAGFDPSTIPGLNSRTPTRLRDAIRLAFAGGAVAVDLIYIRIPGALPWEIDRPELVELLTPFLEGLHETMLVVPDSAGPPRLGPTAVEHPERAWDRIARFVQQHHSGWSDRYQIALLDAPEAGGVPPVALAGDVSLCRWRGEEEGLGRHGWRSAAAAVGGMLVSEGGLVVRRVDGRSMTLPPGRQILRDRRLDLGMKEQYVPPSPSTYFLELDIDPRRDHATILGECSLRAPTLAWPLPALRTVKSLHRRLVMAADLFTFRPVHEANAIALGLAISHVLQPFARAGVVVGPDGRGQPRVGHDMIKDPAAPGLLATVSAQLRPWCHSVQLRVEVHAGASSAVTLSTEAP